MQENLADSDNEKRDDDERQYRKDDRPDNVPPNAVTHVYLPTNELLPATPHLPDVVPNPNMSAFRVIVRPIKPYQIQPTPPGAALPVFVARAGDEAGTRLAPLAQSLELRTRARLTLRQVARTLADQSRQAGPP